MAIAAVGALGTPDDAQQITSIEVTSTNMVP
jgi:hypothetical protein